MKLTVRVRPGSRFTLVEELDDGSYRVAVTAPPERGKANAAVTAALAEHFQVPKSSVQILAGHAAWTKIVEIVQPR
ncbi:DUF167 domain-containing protein [Candidatus Berkelbacteria bacterium]|nr:DUF167 domain-containing protein [Candidatus Berkelbacteria bacterium]